VVTWLYWSALWLPLTGDDWALINAARNWLGASFVGDWLGRGSAPYGFYRPIVILSMWANWHLHGPWPPGYHLANLLLHAVTALVVAAAALVLGKLSRPWALLAAVLFLLRDQTAQSVVFVSGRTGVLSAAAMLAAIVAAAKGVDAGGKLGRARSARSKPVDLAGDSRAPLAPAAGWAALSLVATAFALGSKEDAILLPALTAGVAFVLQRRGGRAGRYWLAVAAGQSALVLAYLLGRRAMFGLSLDSSAYPGALSSLWGDSSAWAWWSRHWVRDPLVLAAMTAALIAASRAKVTRETVALVIAAVLSLGLGRAVSWVHPGWVSAIIAGSLLAAAIALCAWHSDARVKAQGCCLLLSAVALLPGLALAVRGEDRFTYLSGAAQSLAEAIAVSAAAAFAGTSIRARSRSRQLSFTALAVAVLALVSVAGVRIASLRSELVDWQAASLFNHRLVTIIVAQFDETAAGASASDGTGRRRVKVHDWSELDPVRRSSLQWKFDEFTRLMGSRPAIVCLVDEVPGRIGKGIGPQNAFPVMAEVSWEAKRPVGVVFRQEPAGPAAPMTDALNWLVRPLGEPMLVWYAAPEPGPHSSPK